MGIYDYLTNTNKINRLNEFYDWDDLDWYLDNCRMQEVNIDYAIRHLYAQTVVNFITGVEREPEIESSLLRTIIDYANT